MSDDPIITIGHMRKVGFCAAGIRTWFETNDLDFRAMVKNGIPASKLLATNDALAQRVVDFAIRESIDYSDEVTSEQMARLDEAYGQILKNFRPAKGGDGGR